MADHRKEPLRKFDAAEFLKTEKDRAAYLDAYSEDGTVEEREAARVNVDRSRR